MQFNYWINNTKQLTLKWYIEFNKVNGGLHMSILENENASSINRDFFINELNINTLNNKSVLFQNDNISVLSPSVQNSDKAFDIHLSSFNKMESETRGKSLLIVRFYKEKFLVADFMDFKKKILVEDTIHTHRNKKKWPFIVKEVDGRFTIVTSGHRSYEYPIKCMSKQDLKAYINDNFYEIKESDEEDGVKVILPANDLLTHINTYIKSHGFYYSKEDLNNFYLSLRSKPFVIISGISGTGKTKIVELFANSVGATEDNGQFKMIPVRPDWSDSSDLLGYLSLQEEYKKGPLAELIEHAMNYPDLPHFALLDEMNLARVEYYFSDVLSVMESRKKGLDGKVVSSNLVDPILYQKEALGESVGGPLRLTNNLYIIGTVNMDETTHPFSKKVLDRANTIEFNQIELSHFDFLKGVTEKEPAKVISNDNIEASYIHLIDVFTKHQEMVEEISKDIEAINIPLSKINAQVGYRVRDEICFYMVHNKEANLLSENEALDFCYMQKILPRISGGQEVEVVLNSLKALWTEQTVEGQKQTYPRSYAKVEEMKERLKDGFTSFWIA